MTEADKERLAKLIEAKRRYALDGGQLDVAYGLEQAARIVREQPAESAWIAVEDRLPEDADPRAEYVVLSALSGYAFVANYDRVNECFRDPLEGSLIPVRYWQAIPPPPA